MKSYIKLHIGNKNLHTSQNSREEAEENTETKMGKAERGVIVLLMVLAMVAVEVSYGAVYKVGDSAGWTTIGNVNYKKWSATKSFQVGDVISKSSHSYSIYIHNYVHVSLPEHESKFSQKIKLTFFRAKLMS